MSFSQIFCRSINGLQSSEVIVEVNLANGLPQFNIVGLPETEVREAKDRVRAAIQNSHFNFPQKRITVNLAPADLPKQGGSFDLAIALGILSASEQISNAQLNMYEFFGELSLSGLLRPIRGTLPIAISALANHKAIVLPQENIEEAQLIPNLKLYPAHDLNQVCRFLNGQTSLEPPLAQSQARTVFNYPDMADIKGQALARRSLEIAAAGQHSVLLFGAPGSGKSMLAQRLAGILPPMQLQEALDSASILSIRGLFNIQHWQSRPFRSPHHTASVAAIIGGGSSPQPGEISLAHNGVLFLDELPEFDRRVLEALREPLENGFVSIARAKQQINFPAKFQLIAAMNPCPCGFLGVNGYNCRCSSHQISRYRHRLSGPLLDRIDMILEVLPLNLDTLRNQPLGESSHVIRTRVSEAWNIQINRQKCSNRYLNDKSIPLYCSLKKEAQNLLDNACKQLHLSARGYHRLLKVARTIADLEHSHAIGFEHIAEAIQFRRGFDFFNQNF